MTDACASADRRLARLALWLAGIGLVLMTALIAAQVFWRYVLNDTLDLDRSLPRS